MGAKRVEPHRVQCAFWGALDNGIRGEEVVKTVLQDS